MSTRITHLSLPVTITPKAISEIKAIMHQKNIVHSQYGLRIGMKGGGCGGASFLLGFDTQKPTDQSYQLEELPVYIEKKHLMYLIGMEIDFEEGESGSGFVFNMAGAT